MTEGSRFLHVYWDETRGDEFADWGTADYYFATDDAGVVVRQVEVYADGHVLVYDEDHHHDEFGMLTDQPLPRSEQPGELASEEITRAEFETRTRGLRPSNRPTA
jgi:hypothetical protein